MDIRPIYPKGDEKIKIKNKVYFIENKIPFDGSGTVYKAYHQIYDNYHKSSCPLYAIKEMILDSEAKSKDLIVELEFVKKIIANFDKTTFPIVEIFDYQWIESQKALYYVMELEQISLHDYFKQIRQFEDLDRLNAIWVVYSYVLKSLLYFESINIAHRDIRPQNFILLKDESQKWGFNIKLIDFGIVKILGQKNMFPYTAPEMLDDIISIKSDIWSLGIILFELINNGKLPEHVQSLKKTIEFAKSNEDVNFPNCCWILAPIQDIAKKCLVKKYNNRMNASELYQYTIEKYKLDTLDKIIPSSFFNMIEKIKKEYIETREQKN